MWMVDSTIRRDFNVSQLFIKFVTQCQPQVHWSGVFAPVQPISTEDLTLTFCLNRDCRKTLVLNLFFVSHKNNLVSTIHHKVDGVIFLVMGEFDKENQRPNRFEATEHFLTSKCYAVLCSLIIVYSLISLTLHKDLADAETPEELLKSLTKASKQFNHHNSKGHDIEVTDGVAHALVKTLKASLTVRRQFGEKPAAVQLSSEKALRISILCTTLEMVLQCSKEVLVAYIEDFISQDLLTSLSEVVNIFVSHCASSTVRDVALSKVSRILYLVSKHALEFHKEIVQSIQSLLRSDISSDARIDAACAIAALLAHHEVKKHPTVSKELIKMAPIIVSTLSTAAECAPDEQLPEIARALVQIARSSKTSLVKISKRRDTIVNISRLIERESTQSDALKIAALLLNYKASASNLQSSNPSSGIVILRALAKVAQTTDREPIQELAVAILMSFVDEPDDAWKIHQKRIAMDALTSVAYSESDTLMRTNVSFGLCRQLLKRNGKVDEEAQRLYPTIIDFLRFPIESVRLEALFTLDLSTRNEEAAVALMNEYAFIDNMTAVVSSDQPAEHDTALSILFNCSRNKACAEKICLNCNLLKAVIENSTQQDTTSQSPWLKSLELILNIMKDSNNHLHLKEYTELLPWLATAASTIEGEALKKKLVKAIIQLSQLYLDNGITNRFLV